MRHYVVVFLESRLFPGTWVTDHFVREEEREDIPELPVLTAAPGLPPASHQEAIGRLKEWQNEERSPDPSWTLEECLLGRVARLTALWYSDKKDLTRAVHYRLVGKL